jgi:hypothetical protein
MSPAKPHFSLKLQRVCFLLYTMTASSVAIMNSGRMKNDGNSGIIST